MKNYISPLAEVVKFDATDIILASPTKPGKPPIGDNDDFDASAIGFPV